jgi:glycosidase
MKHHWSKNSIFYHIYPLGLCGAPARNDFVSPAVPRLEQLWFWIDHLLELGVNAVYLGPLFESSTHGYDTSNYYQVDRRLGSNSTLVELVSGFHRNGLHVILDGVFHHVGRDFWAFRDVRSNLVQSSYIDWFHGLSFEGLSPLNDPFSYNCWNGHYDLVKLNLGNPLVKSHIFDAVEMWIREFDIDGLRLDVADCLEFSFQRELSAFCRKIRPDFWLMGEVVHGDYRRWVNSDMLDSVTNYECYKGLYSSHVDRNFFEIAYSLNRQFGEKGLYTGLPLYNFADNHDVDRVATQLSNPAHLFTLYTLLFTMPGVPSIYYGSEWGISGKKNNGDDRPLRPSLDLTVTKRSNTHPDLEKWIARLAHLRHDSDALKFGNYRQLFVSHKQFAFCRELPEELVVVVVNASDKTISLNLELSEPGHLRAVDLLNPAITFFIPQGKLAVQDLQPYGSRIIRINRFG